MCSHLTSLFDCGCSAATGGASVNRSCYYTLKASERQGTHLVNMLLTAFEVDSKSTRVAFELRYEGAPLHPSSYQNITTNHVIMYISTTCEYAVSQHPISNRTALPKFLLSRCATHFLLQTNVRLHTLDTFNLCTSHNFVIQLIIIVGSTTTIRTMGSDPPHAHVHHHQL